MYKENDKLNILRFIAAFLIVASHCLPIFGSETADFLYGQWFFRFCVPLFFIISGYYFNKTDKKLKYVGKSLLIYVISTLIYLPFIVKESVSTIYLVQSLIFGYYHLWYLSALVIASFLCYLFYKKLDKPYMKILLIILFIIAVFLDKYRFLFRSINLEEIMGPTWYFIIETFMRGGRNGILMGFPLFSLGFIIANHESKIDFKKNNLIISIIVAFLLGFAEAYILKQLFVSDFSLDVSFFGWLPAPLLFIYCIKYPMKFKRIPGRLMRKTSNYIYIVHALIIKKLVTFAIPGAAKTIIVFFISFVISILFSILINFIRTRILKPNSNSVVKEK